MGMEEYEIIHEAWMHRLDRDRMDGWAEGRSIFGISFFYLYHHPIKQFFYNTVHTNHEHVSKEEKSF
jgi:hypothetical protein